MEPGSSGTAPETRPGREPITEEQYITGAGYQPGTAEEEAAGERTRPTQKKKPWFWNEYVILYLRVWVLCRYEVTSKDELLQGIYLEEYCEPK